jgi:hypothetical protein
MLITPEQARAHLRTDGTDDAADLALKTEAAEQLAAEFLNRQLFADQTALDAAVEAGTAGEAPMVVNSLVRAGILLILGHLYANREDVIAGTATDLPQGSRSLLAPYRVGMGV